MKELSCIILVLVAGAAVLAAGCTGTGTPSSPETNATPATDLSRFALGPSDVPQNFALVSASARDPAGMGSLSRDLGWQGGYTARFSGPAGAGGRPTEIVQSIAIYPSENIPGIVAMADRQDRSDPDLNYTSIALPGTLAGRGFAAKAPAGLYVKPTNANPLVEGPGHHDVAAEYKSDVAEIILAKGDIVEVIRMTGPGADAAAVTALAEKAAAKIP